MEETVKQGAVLKEEVPELAVDGEDTVPVDGICWMRSFMKSMAGMVFWTKHYPYACYNGK